MSKLDEENVFTENGLFTEQSPEEKWQNATIANNFLFYKIMHNNPDVCKELLEILLQIKIDRIDMKAEETIEVDYGKKGVRLDVYAADSKRIYNIEMQATDTGKLPERSRYYQGILDVQALNAGNDYKDLKDSYVIFICVPDIFHKGLAKYTFENVCLEKTDLKLNDRTYKYFFIANNYDKILDEKHNAQWRKQYMEWERQMAYKFREGEAKKARDASIEFLKEGIAPEIIAKCEKLPLEEVLKLKELISSTTTA